ncbi:MAG: hypothetical protein WBD74_03895 [Candidatus Aquilonibacter sp.]
MTILLLSFFLGVASGLRTFTPLAAVFIRQGSIWGIVLGLAAIGEYILDLMPNTPARTGVVGLTARIISGAVGGWFLAAMHGGQGIYGAIAGIIGALIGTYAGYAARIEAIKRIGAYPAAIVGDLIAIGLSALIVTR